MSSPGNGKWKNEMVNKSNDVIKPKIIVVPILRNVEDTIAGITNKVERLIAISLSTGMGLHKNLLID